jgi:hypothetical protein
MVPDKPSIVGYKVRFAPMVFFQPIRLGSGKSHCKKIVSLLARFCEGPLLADCGPNVASAIDTERSLSEGSEDAGSQENDERSARANLHGAVLEQARSACQEQNE